MAYKTKTITPKVFIHNEHLDFVIAANQFIEDKKLGLLIAKLVNEEIETSKISQNLFNAKKRQCWYTSKLVVRGYKDALI